MGKTKEMGQSQTMRNFKCCPKGLDFVQNFWDSNGRF